jgi:hypothetical protein
MCLLGALVLFEGCTLFLCARSYSTYDMVSFVAGGTLLQTENVGGRFSVWLTTTYEIKPEYRSQPYYKVVHGPQGYDRLQRTKLHNVNPTGWYSRPVSHQMGDPLPLLPLPRIGSQLTYRYVSDYGSAFNRRRWFVFTHWLLCGFPLIPLVAILMAKVRRRHVLRRREGTANQAMDGD